MTPDQIRADDDDSDRVRSTFDRADNTARLALELAEAKREIARLRANYMLATDANRLNTRYASAREAVTRERKRAEIAEAEIARLHRDALAEAQAYRAMFVRAQEAEAKLAELTAPATEPSESFVRPIEMPGEVMPEGAFRLSPEEQKQLQARLDAIAESRRAAMREAHNYVIGSGAYGLDLGPVP